MASPPFVIPAPPTGGSTSFATALRLEATTKHFGSPAANDAISLDLV